MLFFRGLLVLSLSSFYLEAHDDVLSTSFHHEIEPSLSMPTIVVVWSQNTDSVLQYKLKSFAIHSSFAEDE